MNKERVVKKWIVVLEIEEEEDGMAPPSEWNWTVLCESTKQIKVLAAGESVKVPVEIG
jgi:hypothetical protein